MMKLKNLEVEVEEKENTLIFRLDGAIRSEIYSDFLEYCREQLKGKNVIMDFRNLKYMSSAGVGALFNLNKVIHDEGFQFIIFGLNESVNQIIELTKLNTAFTIVSTEVEALERLK